MQSIGQMVNPFPNKPCFSRVCSTSLLKTLREKKKLLVTSNFFFSHKVFYPFAEISAIFIKLDIVVCKLFQSGPVKNLSFGKGLRTVGEYRHRPLVLKTDRAITVVDIIVSTSSCPSVLTLNPLPYNPDF